MPAASGGNANSISALVKSMDHENTGILRQVTPGALVLTIVVIKFIDDIVTETASIAIAKTATVAPGCGVYSTVLRGA